MTPLISFAVTTHNEGEYLRALFNQLVQYCTRVDAEIIVMDDHSDDILTNELLDWLPTQGSFARVVRQKFDGDFAAHKNHLNSLCRGKYIFQIDADETLHETLLDSLEQLVTLNDTIDLFLVPRVNTVDGLTDEDIKRWGWQVNHNGYVMWPDYQTRLYRNSPDIKWMGKVHERIVGYKTMAPLPTEEEWAIYHPKTIDRQRKQNDFYATI